MSPEEWAVAKALAKLGAEITTDEQRQRFVDLIDAIEAWHKAHA